MGKKSKRNKKSINQAERKGVIKLKIHPLFFALGFYYALTGKLFLFFTVTVCALMHELGQSFVAEAHGYSLNKITLMPFGAIVSGEVDGLKSKDQILIALAGPMVNLSVSLFFIALWWIYPDCYPYTETAVYASLSLALVNIIPAYPLDGGRVVYAVFSTYMGKKRAGIICKILGVTLGLALIVAFFLIKDKNFSLLLFGVFVLVGACGIEKGGSYLRAYPVLSTQCLLRGAPVKKQAIDGSVTVKKLLSLLERGCVNEVVVYKNGKPLGLLTWEKLQVILTTADLYQPIERFVHL